MNTGTVVMRITALIEVGHFLVLNPMTSNAESCKDFGPFPSREAALAFHDAERVEPYEDEGPELFGGGKKSYRKVFRKGGPLEWFNALWDSERQQPGTFGHGVYESTIRTVSVESKVPA